MEEIIHKLIEIDRTAESLLQQAQAEKESALLEIEEERKHWLQEISAKAQKKIETFEQVEKQAATEQVIALEQKTQSALQAFDRLFKEHHNQWEQEIFDRIIES
ncbi:MAG TPA: hypothetical protein H9671_09340 [Firmicutes bacterium]|nr:hypothetical protein [Bacillota bacterium]